MTAKYVPEVTDKTSGNIELPVEDLRRILETTMGFASEDDSRPSLAVSWLMARKGRVCAFAANPYCLALADTHQPVKTEFDGPVPLVVTKAFLRDTRNPKGGAHADIKFNTSSASLTYPVGIQTVRREWTLTNLTMVNFRTVMPKDDGVPVSSMQLNPYFISLMPHMPGGVRLVFHGPLAPVEAITDGFYAVIMPLRVPTDE